MADDQNQRPYRASEPPVRGSAKAHNSDPLAELARLIGQTDPFAEFGREGTRRAPAQQSDTHVDWNAQPASGSYTEQAAPADTRTPAPAQKLGGSGYYATRAVPDKQPLGEPRGYSGQTYGSQSFGSTPQQGDDLYETDQEARGYPPSQAEYQQHDAYEQDTAHLTEEDYYDDVPPSRRRMGVLAIAAVLALAVIGTAGAFGYRAIFGSSGSTQPPPVIKADAGPSKIVPATTGKDTQSTKLITDRINERGQGEKLVSREEQPMEKPAAAVLSQGTQPSPLGSGVVGSEPKKIRTIAIHPDQPAMADATPGAAPLTAAAPTRAASLPPARPVASPPAKPSADNSTADAEPSPGPGPATRPAPPPIRQAAPAPSNAPLSLNPNAPPVRAPARPAPTPAPARTASVAAPAPIAAAAAPRNGSGSYVQVSSQRSEADAQAAFRSLQGKYPNQLGGRQPMIHKVDLGAKGIFYRAMVGPFANASEATELCSSLKAAGGQCLIQRN